MDIDTHTREAAAKKLTTITYALYALSLFFGIPFIVAIIINYVKKSDVEGTLYESHFRWQIRTFWFTVLWSVIGVVTAFFLVGFLVLAAAGIWYIYRVVRGFLNLNDGKPMYAA